MGCLRSDIVIFGHVNRFFYLLTCSARPDPLAGLRGRTSKRREEGREERDREGEGKEKQPVHQFLRTHVGPVKCGVSCTRDDI